MKHRIAALLTAAAMLLALAPTALAFPVHQCANYEIQINLYENINQSGLLAVSCINSALDEPSYDTVAPYIGMNDKVSSFYAYVPPSYTACLVFFQNIQYSGTFTKYRVAGVQGDATWNVTPNDSYSSSKFTKMIGGNTSCP